MPLVFVGRFDPTQLASVKCPSKLFNAPLTRAFFIMAFGDQRQ